MYILYINDDKNITVYYILYIYTLGIYLLLRDLRRPVPGPA